MTSLRNIIVDLVRALYPGEVEIDLVPREKLISVEEENEARKKPTPVTRIEDSLQPTQFAIENKYYNPLNPDLIEVYLGRPIVNDDKLLPDGHLPNPTNYVAVWDPKTIYIFSEPDDHKFELKTKKKTWFWGYRFPKQIKEKQNTAESNNTTEAGVNNANELNPNSQK